MKRILSVLIAAAMLLSTLAVCVLTVAAADDDYAASNDQFIISTAREDQFMDDDDRGSRPGGVYTDDGFSVNPLDPEYENYKVTWPNNAPYVTVQTLADLSYQGFFMEVRVDDFSYWTVTEDEEGNKNYTYLDRWYAFTIWDSVGVMPAQLGTDEAGNDWGNGLEMLIRVHPGSDYKKNPDPESITYLSHIEWYDDTESVKPATRYRPFDNTPSIPAGTTYEDTVIGADGALYLTFELKFDSTNEEWIPYINGVEVPSKNGQKTITESLKTMLYGDGEYIDENLGYMQAYIGFSMQSAQRDAACSFTVTKIGTSSTDYVVPNEDQGGDNIAAKQRDNAVSDIEFRDPDSDPADPVLLMTGDPDTYKNIRSVSGAAKFANLENGNLQITSNNGAADPMLRPFNEQSYDLRDYPYLALVVKNFCTCAWVDNNFDNIPDPVCTHSESIVMTCVAGDYPNGFSSPTTSVKGNKLDKNFDTPAIEEYVDAEGNTYSIFIFDMNPVLINDGFMDAAQRIHGIYLQYQNIKLDLAGRNIFEMVAVAHLATEEGAIEWSQTFVEDHIGYEEDAPVDTDAPETNAPETSTPDDEPETNAPAGPVIPDADSDLSIEEAADLGLALGNGNYTDGWYFVEGTVVEVLDSEKGVMTITDGDGNTILVNGMFNDAGDLAYNELFDQPIAGDWVYVYGAIGCDDGTPEIKDACLMDYVIEERPDVPVETDPVETDPVDTTPVETDPVETTPVETTPVETDPVETTPVETTPVETDPVETDPVETDPVETDPVETDPKETEAKTDAKTEEKTEAKTEDETDAPQAPVRQGCGSVAGFGAMAIVAVAAIGLVSFKKKED